MPTPQWRAWLAQPVTRLFTGVGRNSLVGAAAPVQQMMTQMSDMRLSYLMVVEDPEQSGGPLLGLVTERRCVQYAHKGLKGSAPVSEAMLPLEHLMTIAPTTTVGESLELINQKIFRHVPVLDPDSRVPVGTLKLRDVLQPIHSSRGFEIPYTKFTPADSRITMMSDTAMSSEVMVVTAEEAEVNDVWGEITVKDVLRAKREHRGVDLADETALARYHREKSTTHSISDTMTVGDAMRELIERRLTFLIVKDDDHEMSGRVLGIVTERSFLNAIAAHTAAGGKVCTLLSDEALNRPVHEIMTPNNEMLSVRTDQMADRCLALMIGSNIRHLPVLGKDGEALAGILSIRDLVAPLVPSMMDGAGTAADDSSKPWWSKMFGG